MATTRQMAANLANAQRSCGPKSDEGKAHSRANSLKHGLTGAGVVVLPEDLDTIAERLESWRSSYVPIGAEQEWAFRQIVVNSVRIDRCQGQEFTIRKHDQTRAEVSWDDDRFAAAEELGARISRDPALIVDRLRRTRQGCLWLSGRWKRLGLLFQQEGAWTDAQKYLAMDLIGMPHELRDPELTTRPDILVTQQLDLLDKLRKESREELDTFERDAACLGLGLTPSKPLALIRRYEQSCQKELKAARALFQSRTPEQPVASEPEPAPKPEPKPEPAPPPVAPPIPPCPPPPIPRTPIRMVSALAEVPQSLNRQQRRAIESQNRG